MAAPHNCTNIRAHAGDGWAFYDWPHPPGTAAMGSSHASVNHQNMVHANIDMAVGFLYKHQAVIDRLDHQLTKLEAEVSAAIKLWNDQYAELSRQMGVAESERAAMTGEIGRLKALVETQSDALRVQAEKIEALMKGNAQLSMQVRDLQEKDKRVAADLLQESDEKKRLEERLMRQEAERAGDRQTITNLENLINGFEARFSDLEARNGFSTAASSVCGDDRDEIDAALSRDLSA